MTRHEHDDDRPADAAALAEELRRAVGTLVRAIRATTDTERSAQSDTLALLDREGAMNVAALAQRRGVTHQTMRVVVAPMIAAGLVARALDPGDRRSQLLSLSDSGRSLVAGERRSRASRLGAIIERTLSTAEQAHLRQSIELLDRISAADG
jgi:DNA-binding MarR family transcriptional regulator